MVTFGVMYCAMAATYTGGFVLMVQETTFWNFMRACAVTLLTLLLWKPLILAVLVALLLKSPRAPYLAASFPGLCDFSHRNLHEKSRGPLATTPALDG